MTSDLALCLTKLKLIKYQESGGNEREKVKKREKVEWGGILVREIKR